MRDITNKQWKMGIKRPLSKFETLKCLRNVDCLINKQANQFIEANNNDPNQNQTTIAMLAGEVLSNIALLKTIFSIACEMNVSLNQAIHEYRRRYHRKKNASKSKIYEFYAYKFLPYIWSNLHRFSKLLGHSRKPKRILYRYSVLQWKEVGQLWWETDFKTKGIFRHNKSDFIYKINTNKIVLKSFKPEQQEHFSYKMLSKMIDLYRGVVRLKRTIVKHPLRAYDTPLGHTQFDVKIIGAKDNKFRIPIYVVDMVDERSGLVFSRMNINASKQFVIDTLIMGIKFFEQYFKVTRVRTDHALMFKKTLAVNTGEFNWELSTRNILHENILWTQPECNGKIERHHRVIDMELLREINKCDNIWEAIELHDKWLKSFNFERTKHFTIYSKTEERWKSFRMLPIEAVTFNFVV